MMPDLMGCEEHGMIDWQVYAPRTRPSFGRCLVCTRNKASRTHYNGPKCVNGHLKTPWTWVVSRSTGYRRCRPCNLAYSRRRAARVKAAP